MPLAIDRYDNFEKLAEGGMGEVYRAEMSGIDNVSKVVAVKLIREDLIENPRFEQLFVQEAKISLTLSHANIVQVFDVGRVNKRYFMSMEFVDGWTLSEVLGWCQYRGKPLPHQYAKLIAVEVLKALDYAHRRKDSEQTPLGLIHRDVSPSNILISREGEVKLTDFGVAKCALKARFSDSNTIVGKVAYMSPEQRAGGEVDRRADIFSLGAVLYQMVVGQPPFETGEFPFAKQRTVTDVQGATEVLRDIVVRSLDSDPEKRFATAAEMADALERAAMDERQFLSSSQLAAFLEELCKEQDEATVVDMGEVDSSTQSDGSVPGGNFNDLLGLELMRVEPSDGASDSIVPVDAGLSIYESHVLADTEVVSDDALADTHLHPDAVGSGASRSVWIGGLVIAAVLTTLVFSSSFDASNSPVKVDVGQPADVPEPVAPPVREPVAEPVDAAPKATESVRPARSAKKRVAVQQWGAVSINTEPWSNIVIDGKPVGVTPVLQLKLRAGVHRIQLENPAAKLKRVISIELKPDEHRRLSVNLRETP